MKVKLYLAIFGASLLIFSATSADRMLTQSRAPHFVYLADSLLHGQLDNRVPPPNNNDWVVFEDKTYVIFPPFPAVLMLPLVALFGIGFNDVIFTVIAAALNVLLMFLVLQLLVREGLSRMSPEENLWLCALFGFGTVHYSCAVIGEVWFTAHIIGVGLTLLYILAATRARHPFLAGLCLVLAFDTRTNLLFTVGYFGLQLFFQRQKDGTFAAGSWKEICLKIALFIAPIVAIGSVQMLMNYVRFHNLFEFGHTYVSGPAGVRIKEHGLFALHYLSRNLYAMFLQVPVIINQFPYLWYNPDGMSIFITTPIFVRLLQPKHKPWIYYILWLTLIPAIIPPLLYQNTGYVQFGFRFALDITPYLVMLLAVEELEFTKINKLLIIFGIIVNLAGAIAFKRYDPI